MAASRTDDSPTNLTEYTVSEISGSIKRTVEDAFGHVRIRGEISGYRGPHASGHAYFALKDERARIEAVVWRSAFRQLKFKPEEGMEMIATGRVTTYPGSSKYQIVIEALEPAGAGALMALLEERRRALAAEGLFAEERKRPLPFMPRVIGVVTSPTGAVIRDILHRIADRFAVHVLVWPVRVQGETCGAEVAAAIAGFNALEPGGPIARPDLLIVARGGGSLEDLWGFNDEAVVRAAAASTIPLISAVGHETDWTLIDHAADRRAPTPTGAAEMAVPVKAELEAGLAGLAARLRAASSRLGERRRQELRALARALPSLDGLLALPRRRFDEAAAGLGRALTMATMEKRRAFERRAGLLTPATLLSGIRDKRQGLAERAARMERAAERRGERHAAMLSRLDYVLAAFPGRARTRIDHGGERLASLAARMAAAERGLLERRKSQYKGCARTLDSLSYKNVLKRGFVLVRGAGDRPIPRAGAVRANTALSLQFADGRVEAMSLGRPRIDPDAETAGKPDRAAPARRKSDARPARPAKQGTLF